MGCRGQGWQQKKRGWFQKGEASWNANMTFEASEEKKSKKKVLQRLTYEECNRSFELTDDQMTPRASRFIEDTPGADHAVGAVLRPREHDTSEVDSAIANL